MDIIFPFVMLPFRSFISSEINSIPMRIYIYSEYHFDRIFHLSFPTPSVTSPSYMTRSVSLIISQKMWYQHMLPSMETDLLGSDVMGAALQPLFFMIEESTEEEYANILFPILKNLMSIPRSVQVTFSVLHLVHNFYNIIFVFRLLGFVIALKTCSSV